MVELKPDKGCSGGQVVHLLQDFDLALTNDLHELEEAQLPSVKFQDLNRVDKSVVNKVAHK
jgi:hypothetical protein